jgi:HAE1 family hydrophobic/amphiphilic exporter-1
VINKVKSDMAALVLPTGVHVQIAGVADVQSESMSQLSLAMLIAVAIVYLVMIVSFGDAIAPLAIMFSLPLAIVGGIFGLLICHLPLDMPAMIGALMLIGIVVTNAIVLVKRVRAEEDKGLDRHAALLEAGGTRIRPILMTATATIMALVPLAAGMAEGALVSQSLAVVVIGGLTSSTFLTLLVVPVAYDLLEGGKHRVLGRLGLSAESPTADEPLPEV